MLMKYWRSMVQKILKKYLSSLQVNNMISVLIIKELKDLIRDPRIWIPFIISAIIMPAIGFAMSIPMKSSQEELAKPINIGIINIDEGDIAEGLVKYIEDNSILLKVNPYIVDKNIFKNISMNEESYKHIIKYFEENGINVELILIIPKDFSEKFRLRDKPSIVTINIVKDISVFSGVKGMRINSIIVNYVREKYLEGTNISLNIILDPYKSYAVSYLKGKEKIIYGDPSTLISSLGFASLFLPLILMIISVSAMQMSATSMAVENEEKTLETLLTFPIPRTHILFAKLIGSFIVAAIGSLFNIAGFIIY
ncbi:MAG TPA: ABC transporter permease, partial [Thermoprotei archaeon]|nr:ABC transporter permease [Thermoprotei archaeon]